MAAKPSLKVVHPEGRDVVRWGVAVFAGLAQVREQVENAGDVIRIQVAHHHHAKRDWGAAAQLLKSRPDAESIDTCRAAVDQNQAASLPLAVVEQQRVAVLRGEGFELEHEGPSDRLDCAEDVDEPRPLEISFAPQIRGRAAQDLLHALRIAQQLPVARK